VTGRVLIEASPCPDCQAGWKQRAFEKGDIGANRLCLDCHGTGYRIPDTVSSPVRYEPGTQIELAVRVPIDPDDPDIDEWGSAAWTKSVSAVRPPTPEETQEV
jgi:hypothetical protein